MILTLRYLGSSTGTQEAQIRERRDMADFAFGTLKQTNVTIHKITF